MQLLSGKYPFALASFSSLKQTRLAGFILLAHGQVGRWYLLEFLLPTKAQSCLPAGRLGFEMTEGIVEPEIIS